MNILAVDDERTALMNIQGKIKEAAPGNDIYGFLKTTDALEFVKNTTCEVAFLDIQMRGMTGIELAKKLKDITPKINIIFVTGFSEYGFDAMELHASGYLLKPVSAEDIRKEMETLRNPVETCDLHVFMAQTFGNFELLYNGVPIKFQRSASKEILAYLIDIRGTSASYAEVAAILWEDEPYDRAKQKQISNYVLDIKNTLKNVNGEKIFITDRKTMRVDINEFECDYYEFLKGNVKYVNSYTGKYLSSYSWAEFTIAYLDNSRRLEDK